MEFLKAAMPYIVGRNWTYFIGGSNDNSAVFIVIYKLQHLGTVTVTQGFPITPSIAMYVESPQFQGRK